MRFPRSRGSLISQILASVALATNRNSARPALQNRRAHSSNGALHPSSSRHGLALASPVQQTRAGPQYQLAASCVANPFVSHVKGGAYSKKIILHRYAALRPHCGLSTPRTKTQTPKKPQIPTAKDKTSRHSRATEPSINQTLTPACTGTVRSLPPFPSISTITQWFCRDCN
jgi:hypothetical protein